MQEVREESGAVLWKATSRGQEQFKLRISISVENGLLFENFLVG